MGPYESYLSLVGRLLLAAIYLWAGFHKVFNPEGSCMSGRTWPERSARICRKKLDATSTLRSFSESNRILKRINPTHLR